MAALLILDSSLEKIRRADEHFVSLQKCIANWVKEGPYAARQTNMYGHITLYAVEQVPPPRRISTIVGDYVHCLRSALDHLTWALAVQQNPKPGNVAFPVFHDPATYRQLGDPMTSALWAQDQARIKALQPYHDLGTKDPLYWVQQLDNFDKHRRLLVMVTASLGQGVAFGAIKDVDVINVSGSGDVDLQDGIVISEFDVYETGPNPILSYRPTYRYGFRFDDSVACVSKLPLIPTLRTMRARIVDVLKNWRYD